MRSLFGDYRAQMEAERREALRVLRTGEERARAHRQSNDAFKKRAGGREGEPREGPRRPRGTGLARVGRGRTRAPGGLGERAQGRRGLGLGRSVRRAGGERLSGAEP